VPIIDADFAKIDGVGVSGDFSRNPSRDRQKLTNPKSRFGFHSPWTNSGREFWPEN
jgi:hypothetical protein